MVNVFSEDDEHKKLLEDHYDVMSEFNLGGTCWRCIDFSDPSSLRHQNLLLKDIKHMRKTILVESMSRGFSLHLPLFIWLREDERVAEQILKHSFELTSFVDLSIFGDEHFLHNRWISDKEIQAAC